MRCLVPHDGAAELVSPDVQVDRLVADFQQPLPAQPGKRAGARIAKAAQNTS